jgi:hypothetical protein
MVSDTGFRGIVAPKGKGNAFVAATSVTDS